MKALTTPTISWFFWAIFLIVAPLYFFSGENVSDWQLLGYIASGAACLMLGVSLNRVDRSNWWAWLLSYVFLVAYFIKSYVIAVMGEESFVTNAEWFDGATLVEEYLWLCFVFFLFALVVTSVHFLGEWKGWHLAESRSSCRDYSTGRLRFLFAALALLSIALLALRIRLGIGVMGIESEKLPFGLDTIMFRCQSSLIPALFLVVMWVAERKDDYFLHKAVIFMLFIHLVALSVVSASKAGVLSFIFYLLSYRVIVGKRRKIKWARLGCLFLLALIFFVAVGAMRIDRIYGAGIVEAFQNFIGTDIADLMELTGTALSFMYFRITGIDQVMIVSQHVAFESDILYRIGRIMEFGLPVYYTREVLDMAALTDFRATGAIGAFMLIGGHAGTLMLVVITTVIIAFLWRFIGNLSCGSPLLCFFSSFVTLLMIDGVLQMSDIIILVLTMLISYYIASHWLSGVSDITNPRRQFICSTEKSC